MTLPQKRKWLGKIKVELARVIAESDDVFVAGLSATSRRKFREELCETITLLDEFAKKMDPIRQPNAVFNPSNPTTIGRMIALCMVNRPSRPLVELASDPFYGGGVYAIYYRGPHPAYAPISGHPIPIYVGKADPEEVEADNAEEHGTKLWHRLTRDHLKNIRLATSNLEAAHFDCRYLVTLSGFESAAERFLIETFQPIWNNELGICYGFGKHGDAAKTRSNTRSPWDTIHPGRRWAWADGNTPNPKTAAEVQADILRHYDVHRPSEMLARLDDLSDILS